MPVFEFECLKCRKKFETFLRNKEEEKDLACQFCSHRKLKKLFSIFGIASARADGISTNTDSGSSCTGCSSNNCSSCH